MSYADPCPVIECPSKYWSDYISYYAWRLFLVFFNPVFVSTTKKGLKKRIIFSFATTPAGKGVPEHPYEVGQGFGWGWTTRGGPELPETDWSRKNFCWKCKFFGGFFRQSFDLIFRETYPHPPQTKKHSRLPSLQPFSNWGIIFYLLKILIMESKFRRIGVSTRGSS